MSECRGYKYEVQQTVSIIIICVGIQHRNLNSEMDSQTVQTNSPNVKESDYNKSLEKMDDNNNNSSNEAVNKTEFTREGEDVCGHRVVNGKFVINSEKPSSEEITQEKVKIRKYFHQNTLPLSFLSDYEVRINRKLDQTRRYPVVVIRRVFQDDVKKQLYLTMGDFSKLCEILKEINNDPFLEKHDFQIKLTGSDNRSNNNCIMVKVMHHQVEIVGEKTIDTRVDIRYWFRKGVDEEWNPTLSGVRLSLTNVFQMINLENVINERCKTVCNINACFDALCNVMVKYFYADNTQSKSVNSMHGKLIKFIRNIDLSYFMQILKKDSKFCVKIFECYKSYDTEDLLSYLKSNEGINEVLACALPHFSINN